MLTPGDQAAHVALRSQGGAGGDSSPQGSQSSAGARLGAQAHQRDSPSVLGETNLGDQWGKSPSEGQV